MLQIPVNPFQRLQADGEIQRGVDGQRVTEGVGRIGRGEGECVPAAHGEADCPYPFEIMYFLEPRVKGSKVLYSFYPFGTVGFAEARVRRQVDREMLG